MKSKLLLLLKTSLINNYKLKSMTKKKLAVMILLIIYVIIALGFTLFTYMTSLYDTLNTMNLTNYYLILVFVLASIFDFVFSIFSAKGWLFGNKDNDLLLSMPIKRDEILASRFISLVLYNFVIGLVFIIPGLIVFFKTNTVSSLHLYSILLLILFFTIIPSILSSIFGYIVALISSKSRRQNVVELICYIIFILAYLGLVSFGNKIMNYFIGNVELLNNVLKILFLPIYLMTKTLMTGNLLYSLGFIITNILVLFIFIKVLNINYLKIITQLSAHKTSSKKYSMKNDQSKSVSKALLFKETKRYFGSAIYIFNTLFGIVFILIGAIASFFLSSNKIIEMANIGDITTFRLVYLLLVLVISLTVTTNSSISMERNSLWIIKSMPIKTKDIFNAKILLNRLLIIPICIISLILFKITGYISFNELLLLCLLTIIYGSFIPNFGLIANLLFPKLDAINETMIVKQSVASFVGIIGGVVIFVLLMSITASIASNIVTIIVSIIISAILLIASKIILIKWGEKRFLQIN